jgi:hypothetical protein
LSPGRAKRGPGDAALRPGNAAGIRPLVLAGARSALIRPIVVARRAVIARAAVTPPAAVQRKAVAAAIVAIRAALRLALLRRLLLLRLAAGDEGRQPVNVLIVGRLRMLRALRKVLLRLRLKVLLRLRLMVLLRLLLAPIERLRLARRKRLAGQMRLLVVAVVEAVVGDVAAHLALLLLIIGLALPVLLLGRGDHAEIMLGVLVIIFGGDGIAGTLRIAGELQVLFGDVGRRTSDLHVRSAGLVHARQWILVMTTTFAVATPHALLTVSHGLLFCQPPVLRLRECRRFTPKSSITTLGPDTIRAGVRYHRLGR